MPQSKRPPNRERAFFSPFPPPSWLFLVSILLFVTSIRGCDARHFFGGQRTPLVAVPRGGSSWRTPAKPTNQQSPFSSSQQNQLFQSDKQQSDDEKTATKEILDAFLTRDSRNTFIARVYAILAGQLLVTGASIALFGTQPALRQWTFGGNGAVVPMVSLVVSTISWFIICSSADARRKSPMKWWLLGLFTLGEAISVGFVSSFYKYRSVLSAMLATVAATASVSLYTALQKNSKHDLSQWGAGLSSCAMIFLVYGIIGLLQTMGVIPANFLPYNDAIYSFFGASLFSFYLAHHTKLIVAGKHAKYQMNEKDYVFGAMTLYNDIINIFIYILRMLGEDRD